MKIERQVEAGSINAVVSHQLLNRQRGLAEMRTHFGDSRMRFVLIERVNPGESPRRRLALAPVRIRWIVFEMFCLDKVMDCIDPKTVDTPVEPEAQHLQHRGTHFRVAPVEVRLLCEKCMIVILPSLLIPGPCAPAEFADPIVWHAAALLGVAPDVPIALCTRARGPTLDEPWMLVRGMVGDEVENDLHPAGLRPRDQRIEIRECAEYRIDVGVVCHIVAEVGHRRGKNRRNPDCIHSELDQIVEPRRDAFEIAYAVAVAILERTRIDLIDDAALPPAVRAQHPRLPVNSSQAGRKAWTRGASTEHCGSAQGTCAPRYFALRLPAYRRLRRGQPSRFCRNPCSGRGCRRANSAPRFRLGRDCDQAALSRRRAPPACKSRTGARRARETSAVGGAAPGRAPCPRRFRLIYLRPRPRA